jgi:uncharacterized membrane protein
MRRTTSGRLLAAASIPILFSGATERWPAWLGRADDDTRRALGGSRGVHVREAIRLEIPTSDAYAFWRRLENLPTFMHHLESVTEEGTASHWVATGPAGLRVAWDAEIINDEPGKLIAWRSLPGSDVTTAGSVNFDEMAGGQATQVTVKLQYAPPAGKAGAAVAMLFGREPSQMIREDLRRLKQMMEAGEVARATSDYDSTGRPA